MNIRQTATYQSLREEINHIPAVSAHDHLRPEGESLASPTDLFHLLLSGMPFVDMVSAGLRTRPGDGVMGDMAPFGERDYEAIWKRLSPWLDHIRDTTEYRHYLRGVQELFDFEGDIDERNWRELNERIIEAQAPGRYREVLRERGKVEAILLDRPFTWEDVQPADRFYSANVFPVTNWVALDRPFRATAGPGGGPLTNLAETIEAFEQMLEKAVRSGIIALKLHQAYIRPLEFNDTPREDAERDFPAPDHNGFTSRYVQDYMANHIARRAGELGLPLCFHTGYQLGNCNDIRNANAVLLTSMIRRFPQTRFDIFHMSYPYCEEALMLAKYFPNVFFNFTFADLLSTTKVVEVLHIGLDLIPSNKMFAWGADSGVVEATYGSLCTTRDCVAQCLAERIEAGSLSRERATRLMHKLMHENATRMYRLDEWREKHPAE